MSKKIATYEDLLEEKARLQELLALQKATVVHQLGLVKDELKPTMSAFTNVFLTISRMGRQPNQSPLVYFGIDLGTQMILKRWLSMKTGWFTRTVIPFVVRYYVSKFVSDKDNPLFRRFHKKEKKDPTE
jgi:hypothetical protein